MSEPMAGNEPMSDEFLAKLRDTIKKYLDAIDRESITPDGIPVYLLIANDIASEALEPLLIDNERLRAANDELSRAYAQFHQEASDETRHLRDEIDRLRTNAVIEPSVLMRNIEAMQLSARLHGVEQMIQTTFANELRLAKENVALRAVLAGSDEQDLKLVDAYIDIELQVRSLRAENAAMRPVVEQVAALYPPRHSEMQPWRICRLCGAPEDNRIVMKHEKWCPVEQARAFLASARQAAESEGE